MSIETSVCSEVADGVLVRAPDFAGVAPEVAEPVVETRARAKAAWGDYIGDEYSAPDAYDRYGLIDIPNDMGADSVRFNECTGTTTYTFGPGPSNVFGHQDY
ncbi:MAG: hypothetical protein AAB373_01985 [Patescibacteria group bacterium]